MTCLNGMKLYNTLTKQKEEFVPLHEGKVSMYVCGPTVYNFIHIGNARPMIVFDTVRRYMEYKGYEVNYVSNFTDVDDKIIKKAMEEGRTAEEVSQQYIEECKKDMHDMNVKPATTHPLATQEIQGMLDMISTLIEKGYAYAAADGTVYYRTRKFKDYGKLSHKNIDDLEAGHRSIKVTGDLKEDPLDFVLWKPKKDGEPYWESPWCQGRPGWHIECSVMSKKYLGDEIDIHAGGEDLIFPHHENEIAQSEAANGKPFAHYWMHNGYINIDNKKMSKSLGNFFTAREVAEQYGYEVIRYMMVQAHYRSPINYCKELLDACKASLERLYACRDTLDRAIAAAKSGEVAPEAAETFAKRKEQFITAMDDDLNTADGMTAIFELVRDLNRMSADAATSKEQLEAGAKLFDELIGVMGLLYNRKKTDEIPAEVTELVEQRKAARKAKDFAEADRLRDAIAALGYAVRETRQGTEITKI